MAGSNRSLKGLCLRGQDLTIDDVHSIAFSHRKVSITNRNQILDRLKSAEKLVENAVETQQKVYGVTTGFGSMADKVVPSEQAEASQANLLAFLSSGTGRPLDTSHVRASMLLRANMFLRNASGVRIDIIERLVKFLNEGVTPLVGELGSIGASGDLVPLATIARAITGEGPACRVLMGDQETTATAALEALDLPPLKLKPKEGLAIVNGTTFSAAIAANCVHPAKNYFGLALTTQAIMIRALLGHDEPFAPFVHDCKPHPGQIWTAKVMRDLLDCPGDATANEKSHLQDSYSLRCLPQYLGPIAEGIARVGQTVEIEMNSVTDNPLIDIEQQCFYQSGNFLGQYIGIAMDDLRRYLGLIAKHLDVQIANLVSPEFNRGLPASLHGNGDLSFNMGLKGLQITGNSIMPMLTYLGNPLVEHYPTHAEQFNQNINSMSWGAANLADQSVDLYSHYAAVSLIFAAQAADLRARSILGHCDGRALLGERLVPLYEAIYQSVDRKPNESSPLVYNDGDQSLESYLESLVYSIRENGSVIEAVQLTISELNNLKLKK